MIKFLATLVLILSFLSLSSQKKFCDGWKDGYDAGKLSQNDQMYIVPICPIARIGGDTYEVGYSRGFKKATGKEVVVLPDADESKEDKFCNGWSKGYKAAMNENNRSIFITPICPIPSINEDNYDAGYIKGYQKALDRLGKTKESKTVVIGDESKTFCEGWDRGFQFGLQEWANDNKKRKRNKITPICPIARINSDTYQDGFERGKQKAFDYMDKQ